ncbi:LLM class flavin-dependent oxidoreductase [Cohnella caldifontis]|uniref:LLM class flavin-dependent oxidoreductase n=1 Tax=Cohnella caldifontis TaxID=3027471 RepID=UPI0023ECB8A2|nr:LLM class flavin-dependent oxidoreductase [Cohnella sp. YIM B05605]
MDIPLGVLDHSWIFHGDTPAEAFRQTVQLAKRAEEWGYRRFWVSEHHDTPNIAGSSPEVLISYLLANTARIRVGSGGVMLQHYSPYKVAENFNALATLAPGRVDLGIGRAAGGLPRSTRALRRGSGDIPDVADKLRELQRFLQVPPEGERPLAGLRAQPVPEIPAQIFMLGASADSGKLAAELGLPYAYALIINKDEDVAARAFDHYRRAYRHGAGEQPRSLLALSVIVADTEEEAARLAADNVRIKFHLPDGLAYTAVTRQEAEAFIRRIGERYPTTVQEAADVYGSPESVRHRLLRLQAKYGVDEFIVSTVVADFAARLRSYELLIQAVGRCTQ